MGKTVPLLCLLVLFNFVTGNKRPHIIFIVADDLGWNDVGWRNPELITPNLDRLAKNGVILNSSYVSPTCSPSRNSMLTGVYPFKVGLQSPSLTPRDRRHLSFEHPTLPERLKHLGYSTHMIGKWHLGFCNWRHTPTQRGFDSFMGFYNGGQDYYKHTKDNAYDFWLNNTVYYPPKREYSTKTFSKRAVHLFKKHKNKKRPMFLYLSYQSVHTPLQVPKKYEQLYNNVQNKDRRAYNGMVSAMDQSIGTIVTALKKYKMLQNSIIVFTTDNGGAAHIVGSNLPLRGSKTTLWEGGTRAVSFVYSKRLFVKRYEHNGLFHAIDWLPTLLAAAGGKQDKSLDGVNQWAMIRGAKPSKRHSFVYAVRHNSAALRFGDYKLIIGHPGSYNRWYETPKSTSSYCSFAEDNNSDNGEIFLYDSLNVAARNIKSYLSWIGTKIPGYSYWKQIRRLKLLQECKDLERKEKARWVFPQYLLYNIREDPTERHNIAGDKPVLFKKMKQKLDRYRKKAVPVKIDKHIPKSTGIVNGIWTPGWC